MTRRKAAEPTTPAGPTCNVVDGCTAPAVLQASRLCNTCGGEAATLRTGAERRRVAIVELDDREEQIKAQARSREGQCGCGDPSSHDGSPPEKRPKAKTPDDYVSQPQPCPRPQSGQLTDLEVLDLRISADQRRDLGTQLEQLEAAAGRVAAEHTHPVFGCEKHQSRLPK